MRTSGRRRGAWVGLAILFGLGLSVAGREASLVDAITIFELAKKHKVPVFSSSSLRYGSETQADQGGNKLPAAAATTVRPARVNE